jgi:hypothetical protein
MHVKQHLKGLIFFREDTQLSLLWQQWRFKIADILSLKTFNSKTISVTPKLLIKQFYTVVRTIYAILNQKQLQAGLLTSRNKLSQAQKQMWLFQNWYVEVTQL